MKPRPNVPKAKPPIATPLRQAERRCQRPSASRSSTRQLLAAALLAQCAAGAQTQVQVVEDLSRLLVGHLGHCIACFGSEYSHPARLRPPLRGRRRPGPGPGARRIDRARGSRARDRERRPHEPGPARPSTSAPRRFCAASGCRCSRCPGTTTSPTRSRRASPRPWREFERQWQTTEPELIGEHAHVVGHQLGAALASPVGRRQRRAARARDRQAPSALLLALSASSRCTTS